MRPTKNITLALAVLIASLSLAATASAKIISQTATAPLSSGGSVSATLSWTPNPKDYDDINIGLTITRDGQQLLSGPLKSKDCPSYCSIPAGKGVTAVHAVDLLGSGEPVVFVDLYTGGAHCCFVSQFYNYRAGSYRSYEELWGDPGYKLEKLGGTYVFQTANDEFAYEFTDYADSGMPLKLLSYSATKLVDITRRFPSQIAADAASWLKDYKSTAPSYEDSTGLIAPWAADEDELGKSAMVASYLKAQAAAGHLNTANGLTSEEPSGTRFITKLNAFLKAQGYLK